MERGLITHLHPFSPGEKGPGDEGNRATPPHFDRCPAIIGIVQLDMVIPTALRETTDIFKTYELSKVYMGCTNCAGLVICSGAMCVLCGISGKWMPGCPVNGSTPGEGCSKNQILTKTSSLYPSRTIQRTGKEYWSFFETGPRGAGNQFTILGVFVNLRIGHRLRSCTTHYSQRILGCHQPHA